MPRLPLARLLLVLAAAVLLTSCARSIKEAGAGGRGVPTRPAGSRPPATSAPPTTARHRAPESPAHQVAAAWVRSVRAFYLAGEREDPTYRPLVSSFVEGSPALEQTLSWLTMLEDAGVVAPGRFRVGAVHLVRLGASSATLTGCTWDTGSVYRATGAPAPVSLGGGAGLTSSVAVLRRVDRTWLVWSDRTSSVSSPSTKGPCHGF
ncbi:MAG TPA: hypothetical protein VFN50_01860 [Acidimicrobiales bacterium]|nr:hypothetical protein [Acidimicrobiales bacterium]